MNDPLIIKGSNVQLSNTIIKIFQKYKKHLKKFQDQEKNHKKPKKLRNKTIEIFGKNKKKD